MPFTRFSVLQVLRDEDECELCNESVFTSTTWKFHENVHTLHYFVFLYGKLLLTLFCRPLMKDHSMNSIFCRKGFSKIIGTCDIKHRYVKMKLKFWAASSSLPVISIWTISSILDIAFSDTHVLSASFSLSEISATRLLQILPNQVFTDWNMISWICQISQCETLYV